MSTCLLQSEKDKLVAAIRSGDLDMSRLYDMSNDEARGVFEKVVGSDSAKLVNAEFEKAKIAATKKAAADYVTSSEKEGFRQTASQGEFAKKLLSDSQKRDRAVSSIDERIQKAKDLQTKNAEKIRNATDPEQKANLRSKDQKYQDTIDRLNIRREDTATPVNDRLVNKINSLQTLLSDSDYNDLASAKLGRDITPAQGDYIAKQATILRDLAQDTENPENKDFGMSAEYYNRKANLQSFIDNLDPSAPLNVLGRIIDISRLSLITGLSTPLKVLANYTNHPAGIVLRRIASLSLRGDNAGVAKELNTKDAEFTQKTGTSLSQLRDKNDIGSILGSHKSDSAFGKNEAFDKPNDMTGKGVLGAVSKALTPIEKAFYKVAITLEHTYSFNYVWRNTFYDVLNIRASSFARAEGLKGADVKPRAEEIMRDAARLDPQTEAGKALREGAQAVAARTTNTNDTAVSRLAVGLKNAINSATPGVNLGDLIEPMAKIPANVIANSIATSPIGAVGGLWDVVKGKVGMMGDKPLEEKYQGMLQYKKGIESLIGIVGSLAAAGIITSNLTSKDFRYDKYGNSFMKVGDLWINTEYIARIAPNVAGMMSVKMNPKQNPVKEFITGNAVGEGALGSIIKAPGINVLDQAANAALGPKPVSTALSSGESRVPSILTNFFKPGDLERKGFRVFFGASGVETAEEYKQDQKDAAKKAAVTKRANAQAKAKGQQTL